ncbi:hypothetical protein FEM48_Zijuj03G0004500 [Ziziphus jujuba var. spinosa]|uniref:AAA+ ATPase domain-containing protein n=1 Tax=Ziziphus jujuba var. spinosa TaxID=714518 RepID=A0A978VM50_ZIZJJ|nr:hypothetical protein FEM48_Zijuj03G0004500 [Ziziphus jujuba var. spinosa]
MKPMVGVLLHGPPGYGKTTLDHAIGNEIGLLFYPISATKVISGVSDSKTSDYTSGNILVIGATNWPNTIDPARRRPGRFGREIELGVPDENARAQILGVLTSNQRVEGSFDLLKIARSTASFVEADLVDVVDKAANLALNRVIDERKSLISEDSMDKEHSIWWRRPLLPQEEDSLFITMADFEQAVEQVQPSSKREGFSTIPDEKWQNVGGLDLLGEEFVRDIVWHVKYLEIHQEYREHMEAGILLYGPPGCGKTLLAKAIAYEAGVHFIHIMGPELLNKYVGESEWAIRTLFSRARTSAPCILFSDEADALTKERGTDGGPVADRLLNKLLIELDGGHRRRGVFVIGATNRPIDDSVDLSAIGEACENFSGENLANLMKRAVQAAIHETLTSNESSLSTSTRTIKTTHFELALTEISPSMSKRQKRHYKKLSKRFKAA